MFAAGLLLCGGLAWWAYLTWVAPGKTAGPVVVTPVAPALAPPAQEPAPAATPAVTSVADGGCPAQPMLPRTGPRDGQFSLQAALATNPAAEPSAFLTVAGEMAADGRARDAEVAYLVACRVAVQASGAPSTPVADVKTQLGQHYSAVAGQPAARELRPQVLERAQALLDDSVRAYAALLGKNASKTRIAGERLAAVMQAGQPTEIIRSGAGDPATLGAAAANAEAAAVLDPNAGADCASARSPAEKLICTDAELAEMDRDLDRLRAQARAVTRDPGGFARRQEDAWARRESQCRGDKACLRTWYAQRRKELFREF
ncbi:hypothetical protein [Ramlibacter sp.]|uniref:lysozyme inhibitor LprI family protein n=1 Tax=Ramlibacter sp. TaxID=1917967 RepID=UPI002636DCA0|nr:hypothetical protein [Ramlibacter sp.]